MLSRLKSPHGQRYLLHVNVSKKGAVAGKQVVLCTLLDFPSQLRMRTPSPWGRVDSPEQGTNKNLCEVLFGRYAGKHNKTTIQINSVKPSVSLVELFCIVYGFPSAE